jgi:hypothetical protein
MCSGYVWEAAYASARVRCPGILRKEMREEDNPWRASSKVCIKVSSAGRTKK